MASNRRTSSPNTVEIGAADEPLGGSSPAVNLALEAMALDASLGGYTDIAGAAKYLKVSEEWLSKCRRFGGGPPFARLTNVLIRYHIPTLALWAAQRSYASVADYPPGPRRGRRAPAKEREAA
jgi:hypothetical protein